MMVRKLTLALLLVASSTQPATSHSGGTNANGCHTNHQTGDYHCHGAKGPAPGNTTYCHVVDGERRCGYSQSTCENLVSTYGGYCQRE